MPQAQGLGLADIQAGNIGRQNIAHMREQRSFVALFQFGFQLVGLVEMVFDAAFVAAGNKHQFGAAGGYGLFHCVLNQRLIHNR